MANAGRVSSGRSAVRVTLEGSGNSNVSTGLPVLDHLLGLLASRAGFDLTLEVEPGELESEVAAAGRALGEALRDPLRVEGVRGHGSAVVPADEALAHVTLEASGRPLVESNVDLTAERVGGLGSDFVAGFLGALTEGAGLTLHARLIEGRDPQHVLEAIFKSLGVALAQACSPKRRPR
jgi:imidazoleglycerol-phosphate dehydratase